MDLRYIFPWAKRVYDALSVVELAAPHTDASEIKRCLCLNWTMTSRLAHFLLIIVCFVLFLMGKGGGGGVRGGGLDISCKNKKQTNVKAQNCHKFYKRHFWLMEAQMDSSVTLQSVERTSALVSKPFCARKQASNPPPPPPHTHTHL